MRKAFYLCEISDRSLEKITLQYKKIQKKGQNMAEKILAFDDWKTKYYPAWYLNSQEKDEELFEEWLEYKRAAEAIPENEQA